MELSDGHLQKSLQAASFRIGCFVPDLLQHVMGGVPLLRVEQADGLLEAGIRFNHQRLAIFLAGSLRSRMDSGVTSSISSGPMYSRARSSVICTGA